MEAQEAKPAWWRPPTPKEEDALRFMLRFCVSIGRASHVDAGKMAIRSSANKLVASVLPALADYPHASVRDAVAALPQLIRPFGGVVNNAPSGDELEQLKVLIAKEAWKVVTVVTAPGSPERHARQSLEALANKSAKRYIPRRVPIRDSEPSLRPRKLKSKPSTIDRLTPGTGQLVLGAIQTLASRKPDLNFVKDVSDAMRPLSTYTPVETREAWRRTRVALAEALAASRFPNGAIVGLARRREVAAVVAEQYRELCRVSNQRDALQQVTRMLAQRFEDCQPSHRLSAWTKLDDRPPRAVRLDAEGMVVIDRVFNELNQNSPDYDAVQYVTCAMVMPPPSFEAQQPEAVALWKELRDLLDEYVQRRPEEGPSAEFRGMLSDAQSAYWTLEAELVTALVLDTGPTLEQGF